MMSAHRSRVLPILGLLGLAAVSAVAVVLVASYGDGSGESRVVRTLPADGQMPTGEPAPDAGSTAPPVVRRGIEARGTLEPNTILFGDTIEAHVDVLLDRRRVDPDSVRVATDFLPWEIVGKAQRVRRDAGSLTYLRTTYVLRCLTGPCVPPGAVAPLDFDPARVSYRRLPNASGDPVGGSRRAEWPVLTVHSRFASAAFEDPRSLSTPWRADVLTLPAASWFVPPSVLLAALVALATVLALAGATLVYLSWPRKAPPPPPEPEPEPLPELTPLELALVLLRDAARADGVEDRRRSLELVAEALSGHGDAELARTARTLAWSEDEPAVEQTSDLAARVRDALELEGETADHEGNGRVV